MKDRKPLSEGASVSPPTSQPSAAQEQRKVEKIDNQTKQKASDENKPSSPKILLQSEANETTRTTTTTTSHRAKVLVRHLSGSPKWKDYDESTEVFIQQFPKVELHVHLDGAFDPDVLWEYLQQHKPDSITSLPQETLLPWEAEDSPNKSLLVQDLVSQCETSQDYHTLCTCRGHRSLRHMLKCFEIFLPTVRCNLDLLEQLAFDFVQRQWQQNVVYTEVRYSPFFLAEGYKKDNNEEEEKDNSVTGQDVYDCITEGLRRGCQQYGIVVNQIMSCITWRPDFAQSTLDLVQRHRQDYPCAAVGIDIASGEEHYDATQFAHLYQPHYDVMQQAKAANVPITLHAGEVPNTDTGSNNVRRSVLDYGASRIGHGYRIASHPQVMEEMKRANIHFEVCPTSSLETGGWMYDSPNAVSTIASPTTTIDEKSNDKDDDVDDKDWRKHPCRVMQAHGLSISLNSDDPAVFHTSLAWQYRTALIKMGMSRFELYKSNMDAIEAAFCDDETKTAMKRQIQHFCERTGVIDAKHGEELLIAAAEQQQAKNADEGQQYSTHSDQGATATPTTTAKQSVYRRSLSENFKDRVYLKTDAATAIGHTTSTSQAAENGEDINFYL